MVTVNEARAPHLRVPPRRLTTWRAVLREWHPEYVQTRLWLAASERWDLERLEQWQWLQVSRLLKWAWQRVPYYRRTWEEAGVAPDRIRSLADFVNQVPLVDKRDLREHLDEALASGLSSGRSIYVTTGGSTGIPFGFFDDAWRSWPRERAFFDHLWAEMGYRRGDASVVLRGTPVAGESGGALWRQEGHEWIFSSYHLTDENMSRYLREWGRLRLPFIQAYPSAIALVADHMRRHGVPRPDYVRAVFLGSENVYPGQRTLVEDAFGCRTFSWYGHAEKAALAGECAESRDYHVFPQYGFLELVSSDGSPVTQPGVVGEIVATGFNNRVMPFIRYRTMDLGVWAAPGRCACGRAYRRLARVDGRLQEMIVTRDGRRISMTAINMHTPVFDRVRQFQFVQNEPGRIEMHIVPHPDYEAADEEGIRRELTEKWGSEIELSITRVPEIARTASGKLRFLVQNLPAVGHG